MGRSRTPQASSPDEVFDAFLDGPRPADPIEAKLQHVARKGMESARAAAAAAAPEPERGERAEVGESERQVPARVPATMRSRSLEARLSTARDGLSPLDSDVFTSYPLSPQREFPTALTRMPIFRPSRRVTQQAIQDTDNAVSFATGWGEGRRLGPPLTIRDEDTLICLIRLRDRAIVGPASALPTVLREVRESTGETTEVHRLRCTLQMVVDELGLRDGGTAYSTTLASIRRLGGCTVELVHRSEDGRRSMGKQFRLIDVNWMAYDEHAVVEVVFPPLMAGWLRDTYSYLDWPVRRRLKGALTKALHRFLSGQRDSYAIGLDKVAAAVGFDGRREHMRTKFGGACRELVEAGWLERWKIEGNGRTEPLILTIRRR